MRVETSESGLLGFVRRHTVEVLAALYTLTVIYNSLVPLDFSTRPHTLERSVGSFAGLRTIPVSIPDAVSNIAFYLPLGALLAATLTKAGVGRRLAVIPAVVAAALISYAMEWGQSWSLTRVSTAYDWGFNMLGAGVGAALARPLAAYGRRVIARFRRDVRDRPSLALVGGFGLALLMLALLPLDVTFSVDRLRAALGTAYGIPFSKLHDLDVLYDRATAVLLAERLAPLREWWMLALDYATWAVLYAVLALLACAYLRRHCRMSGGQAAAHALGMCAIYALGSSALQFFVISRGLDATVPLSQIGGAALGVAVQPMVLGRLAGRSPEHGQFGAARLNRWLDFGFTVVIVGIVLRELVPFRFDVSAAGVAAQVARIDWLPMGAYQAARFHVAVDDVARKVLRFAVLGALIAARRDVCGWPMPIGGRWRLAAAAALGTGGLEVVQLLLPSRIPGVTDLFLAGLGAVSGAYAYGVVQLWWGEVTQAGLAPAPVRVDYRVELGAPDDPQAPREQVPDVRQPQLEPEPDPEP